jgi:hypothetical protein
MNDKNHVDKIAQDRKGHAVKRNQDVIACPRNGSYCKFSALSLSTFLSLFIGENTSQKEGDYHGFLNTESGVNTINQPFRIRRYSKRDVHTINKPN